VGAHGNKIGGRPAPARAAAIRTTRLEAALDWARGHSLAAFPIANSCCAAEFEASLGPRYDLGRLGCSVPECAPVQADLLMVLGSVSLRLAPLVRETFEQMREPKWVIAAGACACTGGGYDNYATIQGVDRLVPVDVYIPGCPPRPEALVEGLGRLAEKIARGGGNIAGARSS
jgi:NADH-quinone oxidoreductase subunit B